MKCFYHATADAVGSCKSCGRGVCAECAVDMGKGLACRGRCEGDVEALIQLIDRNMTFTRATVQLMPGQRRIGILSGVLIFAMGLVFAVWAFRTRLVVIAVAGALFGAIGFLQAVSAARTPKPRRE